MSKAPAGWFAELTGLPLRLLPTLPYSESETTQETPWAAEAQGQGACAQPGGPRAFEGRAFPIPDGARLALSRPNGSGKTT
ncbi:MAG: hypothetical protein ACK467_08935, partial [Opitutia bacterium]